jgi:hypothetical protein
MYGETTTREMRLGKIHGDPGVTIDGWDLRIFVEMVAMHKCK